MTKYLTAIEQEDGWTDWIKPKIHGYKMACCDCGLIHDFEFAVFDEDGKEIKGAVMFRARRNKRATSQRRRKIKWNAK